ncbi:hypothetical protein LOTGIDRAFT_228656 [Lottia gigantea]|uniref:Ig-like domain-containing protein n=1 Tax=Lottia gigantea TaxID=225164 RepID=V4AK83_LOTGI|nr:hypothetical protein LOTGIDRAFT_228656 [Lottia gigantea]ESO93956.1 hypothetical protein LOTGIDRAFT_228656 [Lottia gigantea]
MDYQGERNILSWTGFLCLMALIVSVNCGEINTFPNKQGLLNGPLDITCSYNLKQGEILDSVTIFRQKSGDVSGYKNIVRFTPSGTNYYSDGEDLRDRSALSLQNNVATLAITSVKCVDEAQYRCVLSFFTNTSLIAGDDKIMPGGLTVQGGPQKPSQLNQSPTDVASEYESVTFTCVAEIGKSPKGAIKWEKVMADNSKEIISESVTNVESETKDSCTKTMTSKLVLNVTQADNGKKIQCSTTHQNLQDPNHFRITNSLIVNYPVNQPNVYQTPNKPAQVEGDRVVLTCTANSVPAATYKWHHIESNVTYDANSNGEKVFLNIQLSDIGTYRCDAMNTYQNQTFTASKSVLVQVEKQTTPSPTSSPGTSSSKPGGATQPSTGGNDDNETLIIIIVCVVVGLLIIAGIILFIICRKKRQEKIKSQKIETPSEKPYNNNPAINRYASRQPDLVSDEKKLYANQQLHPYNNPNSSYNNNPYDYNPNTSFDKRSEDFSSYGDINFDDRPRSRKPVALSDADYADISMPRV